MAANSSDQLLQQTQIMGLNVIESTKLDGNFTVNKTETDRENSEFTIEAITDCKKDGEVRLTLYGLLFQKKFKQGGLRIYFSERPPWKF